MMRTHDVWAGSCLPGIWIPRAPFRSTPQLFDSGCTSFKDSLVKLRSRLRAMCRQQTRCLQWICRRKPWIRQGHVAGMQEAKY